MTNTTITTSNECQLKGKRFTVPGKSAGKDFPFYATLVGDKVQLVVGFTRFEVDIDTFDNLHAALHGDMTGVVSAKGREIRV